MHQRGLGGLVWINTSWLDRRVFTRKNTCRMHRKGGWKNKHNWSKLFALACRFSWTVMGGGSCTKSFKHLVFWHWPCCSNLLSSLHGTYHYDIHFAFCKLPQALHIAWYPCMQSFVLCFDGGRLGRASNPKIPSPQLPALRCSPLTIHRNMHWFTFNLAFPCIPCISMINDSKDHVIDSIHHL